MRHIIGSYACRCLLITLGIVPFTFFSCVNDNKEKVVQQLEMTIANKSGDNITIEAATQGTFIQVFSDERWQLTLDFLGGEKWCRIPESYDSGTESRGDVPLLFSQNTAENYRSVEIILEAGSQDRIVVTLTQKGTGGGTGPGPDPGEPEEPEYTMKWIELPELGSLEDYRFVTHFAQIENTTYRNYSLLYDPAEKISYWVAYPHNPVYTGSQERTNNWRYDPQIPENLQPRVRSGIPGYDRGHQIPSMDRTANATINAQTFYFTNMTPQLGRVLNQAWWQNLETRIKNTWMPAADTLYVVTGAILNKPGESRQVTYASDNDGSPIAVPNYYYKVLLSLKNGVYDKAIGFWIDHEAKSGPPTVNEAYSVAEVEEFSGFRFFVNLTEEQATVKQSFRAQDWGL